MQTEDQLSQMWADPQLLSLWADTKDGSESLGKNWG